MQGRCVGLELFDRQRQTELQMVGMALQMVGTQLTCVHFQMRTPEEKKRLVAAVAGAYVTVWAFFYFTHDSGEVSE